MSFSVITHSPEETYRVGRALGTLVRPGDILLLEGLLGTGKTCLAQGLAQGMGISAPVTSPTFILVNQYPGPVTLYHIDLYRIEALAEAEDLGLDDYFFGEGVCVVEWPDRAPSAMPLDHLLVALEYLGERQRRLTFGPHGGRYLALVQRFREALNSCSTTAEKAGGEGVPHLDAGPRDPAR